MKMSEPYNLFFDADTFVLDDEKFLNKLKNNSLQQQQYNCIYGSPTISSKVTETWSPTSSGSIVSPREAPSKTSSLQSVEKWTPDLEEFWYNFSVEEISFGQEANDTTDIVVLCNEKYIKSTVYKLWNRSVSVHEGLFFITPSFIPSFTYSHETCKIYPCTTYPRLSSSTFPFKRKRLYLNNFDSDLDIPSVATTTSEQLLSPVKSTDSPKNWWKPVCKDKPVPVSSVTRVPSPKCPAEEILNKYFAQQESMEMDKLLTDLDLSSSKSDFSPPRDRTSTPITDSDWQDNILHKFFVEWNITEASNAAPALKPEYSERRPTSSVKPDHRRSQKRPTRPEPITFEDFMHGRGKNVAAKSRQTQNQRNEKQYTFCKFCYKNGELSDIYMSHITKHADGSIVCPILRKYVCDICGATGDRAHTRKYCAFNTQQNRSMPMFRRLTNGVLTSCHNHK